MADSAEDDDPPQPAANRRRRRRAPSRDDSAAGASGSSPPGTPGTAPSSSALAVPSARGEKLHSTDQKLLRSPVQLDESDLFPSDQDPRFLVQPPVPSLGAHGETYAEGVGGGRRFRKTMGADGERLLTSASAVADAQALRLPAISPLAGTQAAFFLMGVCFHGSAGIVAGLSLAQSLASPGFGKATLTMHMAYASVALVLQRATNALGLFAFIGATDRHLGARTWSSGVVVCLYGFYAMLVAMQLPVDAVLHDGRRERVPAMLAHLLAAGDDPELLRLDDTTAFPEMALETPAEDEFIDFTTLSGTLLDYHSLLSMLRTIAALIAWVITCREDSTLLITVPPLPREG